MPSLNRVISGPPSGLDPAVCEQEPIHTPGAIQPHGALIAILVDSQIITHASANLLDILGQAPDTVLGRPLEHIIGNAAEYILKSTTPGKETVIKQQSARNGQLLRFHAFRTGRHIAIDIQPVDFDLGAHSSMTGVLAVLETFERATNRTELYQAAIVGLQAISGYDRVMVYQFDDQGHGEVVAEVHAAHLEPYLGNHYPTTDIPPQARRQYLRKRTGSVANSSYQPVPLLTEAEFTYAEPLDLTDSSLRSVSPIHREFMRNMGTSASLSISLVSGSNLFGLILCHHSVPRIAEPDLRAAADMVGRVVSLLVISLGQAEVYAERKARSATLNAIVAMLALPIPLASALVAAELELLRLLDATGAVICLGGSLLRLGTTPPPIVTAQLLTIMESKPAGEITMMDDVALVHPELVDCAADGSGVLFLPLSPGGEDLILWFRPELSRIVTWAGNPDEHTQDQVTGQILPRASFAVWKQTTHGRSKPWTGTDSALATDLRRAFEEEVAKRVRGELTLLRQYEEKNDGLEIKISQHTKALEKETLQRLKAEASETVMRESETRFRRAVEASPSAMVIVSKRGLIAMVNTQTENVFGYRRDEMLGKAVEMLVPERFRGHHPALRGAFFSDPLSRPMGAGRDLFGLRKDGTEFPVEIGLNPIETDEGTMVLSAIVDISARKRLEERFRLVVEAAPNAMVMIRATGQIEMVNTHAERVFGYRRDEMLGKPVEMLVPERFRGHHPALRGGFFTDPLSRPMGAGRDLFGLRQDGTEFPVEIGLNPIETDDGTMVLSAIVDKSERHRNEMERERQRRELERSNADLEEFPYIASHDLKEPLRGIANNARFLHEDYAETLDQAGIDRLLRLSYLSQRMEQLINDLLYFSRLGHPESDVHLTDLNVVIRDIELMMETTLKERNAAIVIPLRLPLVSCNKTRITEVFRNLITNAIKYNDNATRQVEIGYYNEVTRKAGVERPVFYVKDNGIGIEDEFHEEIFRIFKRLNSEDDDKKGTGVGLTFVRRIVERDGGRVWLKSVPGEGSTFFFTMDLGSGS